MKITIQNKITKISLLAISFSFIISACSINQSYYVKPKNKQSKKHKKLETKTGNFTIWAAACTFAATAAGTLYCIYKNFDKPKSNKQNSNLQNKDEKINGLTKQNNKLNQQINYLRSKNNGLNIKSNELQANVQSVTEQDRTFTVENNKLTEQNKVLNTKNNELQNANEQIVKLNQDLANAKKTILNMTNIVGVKQTFPTVQETIETYRSIRDQKHHNTSTALKKFLKKNNKAWQKYYTNQIVHEIMFYTLIECYNQVKKYKESIYNNIGKILNMKQAIKDKYSDEDEEKNNDNKDDDDDYINKEIIRILSNRLNSYFKNNFKTILKGGKIEEKVLENVLKQDYCKHLKVDNSFNSFKSFKSFESVNSSKKTHILGDEFMEYIHECCEICWVMVLQNPILHIKPNVWEYNEKVYKCKYDENIHKNVLGSGRNCKKILYYVWPAVARNNIILSDQKIGIVLKDDFYKPPNQKKKKNPKDRFYNLR